MRTRHALHAVAGVEAASLALLLANVLTVHTEAVTSLGGPLHGTAYLAIIVITWLAPETASPGTRPLALVPGIGGLLVLRRVRRQQ